MAEEGGIRQFLDIGSGIPTRQNVHEIAREAAPGSQVVYVGQDDVAAVIQADLRDPPDSPGEVPADPADFPLLAGVGRLD